MAKINGQLERAQLELLSQTGGAPNPFPSAPNLPGRIFADVTNPASAVPMFQDGTTNKQLAFYEPPAPLVTVNSGLAVTIDWSAGLIQKVILTNNAVISFSNPQGGQIHTLIVQQGLTASPVNQFVYTLNMPDQENRGLPFQPNGAMDSQRNDVYQWFYKTAIRAAQLSASAYTSFQPAANLLPATLTTGLEISPLGDAYVGGRTTTPFTNVLRLKKGLLNIQQPYSQQWIAPVAIGFQSRGVAYGKDGQTVFHAMASSPFIAGTHVMFGANLGNFANPGVLPAGASQCVAVHPSNSYVGVGHTTSPFLSIYPVDGTAFGTKVTDPGTLPAAQVNSLAWSATGDFLAVASQTTPFIQVYPWSSAGFGAIIANPGSLPTGGPEGSLGKGIAWRPQGDYIAMAMTVSPYLYVVPFNRATSTFGTPLTVTSGPAASLNCVQWSPCGQYLVCGGSSADPVIIYDFSAQNLSNRLGLFAASVQVNDISFHPSGDYFLLGLNSTPFIVGYWMPWVQKNYLKLLE